MDRNLEVLTHFLELQTKNHKLGYSIFKKGHLVYSTSSFQEDICKALLRFQNKVDNRSLDYLITENFLLYGYILGDNFPEKNLEIIIGPGTVGFFSSHELKKIQSSLSKTVISKEHTSNTISRIENTSLQIFLNTICVLHCFMNNRIIQPQSLITSPIEEKTLLVQIQNKLNQFEQENQFENDHTNTINYEKKISFCIRHGDLEALKKILESFSHTLNRLGPDALRHSKNACIILNSLALRAAIKGGIDSDICYRLGGIYIGKIESSNNIQDLSLLSIVMVKDYCMRVQSIQPFSNRLKEFNDEDIIKCTNYISDHFREKIKVSSIAEYVGYSPEYLSTKFKRITGKNLPQYINEKKIIEAKRQLALSDYPISDISNNLAFTSQSYFHKIFKKYVGVTPLKYRKSNKV